MSSAPATTSREYAATARVVPGIRMAESPLTGNRVAGMSGGVSHPLMSSTPSAAPFRPVLQLRPPRQPSNGLLQTFVGDFAVVLGTILLVHAVPMTMQMQRPAAVWKHVVFSDLGVVLVYALLVSTLRAAMDSGRNKPCGHIAALWSTAKPILLTTIAVGAGIKLSGGGSLSMTMLAGAAFANIAAVLIRDDVLHRLVRHQRARVRAAKRVLIVGNNFVGRDVATYLDCHPEHGRTIVGFLDPASRPGPRILGAFDDFSRVARAGFIDEVIIALPHDREGTRAAIDVARRQNLDIQVVPELFEHSPDAARVEKLGSIPILPLHEQPIPSGALLCKRILDVALSAATLIAGWPLLAAIALAVRLDSTGPALYRAPRAGKKGRLFLCYKFRTMRTDADRLKEALRSRHNERNGPMFKLTDDPRITRVGHWLRRYSLDELPQLWNVLLGDMSLVGPRPHPVDDYRLYDVTDLRRLDVTPGLTGAWQISARREASFVLSMALDLDYIEHWSLWTDIRILFRTVGVVLRGTGV